MRSWYQAAQDAYRKSPATTERPETNASLAALAEQAQRNPAVFEAEDELELLRALRIADEFKLRPILFGNGYEYRVRKALAEKKRPSFCPLDFPSRRRSNGRSRRWNMGWMNCSTGTARRVIPRAWPKLGFRFAFTTQKLEKPGEGILVAPSSRCAPRFEQGCCAGGFDEHAGGNVRRGGPTRNDRAGADGESGRSERRPFADDARVLTTWVDGAITIRSRRGTAICAGHGNSWRKAKRSPLVVEGKPEKLEAKMAGEKATVSMEGRRGAVGRARKIVREGRRLDPLDRPDRRGNDRRHWRSAGGAANSLEREAHRALTRHEKAGRKTIAAR